MKISSVSTFLAFIEQTKKTEVSENNNADFLFRGQSTDEPLIPRIARLKPKGSFRQIETLLLAEFERQSLPFREFQPNDSWDIIAQAQHHGLPTRLLDWSYSALAALWFCVNKAPKKDDNNNQLDGVVWIFKTTVEDFINFPTSETPFTKGITRIFRPRAVSQRILAQTGVFTCHRRTKEGKFTPLQLHPRYMDRLVKIDVPASSFSGIRDQLNACGVNSVSLFPDLDGLTRHLEYRYFHLA